MMDGYKQDFVKFLTNSGALKFGEFTTKSGRLSPYFINTGEFRTGAQIAALGEFYAACIAEHMDNGDIAGGRDGADILFGPAYKGIPLAVAASIALARDHGIDLGYCFNRKEEKDHGEGGSFVGEKPAPGSRVILIDDVITAGTAVRETLPLVLGAAPDVSVIAMFISVDRMERGAGELSAVGEVSRDFGIPVYPIIDVRDIMALQEGAARAAMESYLAEYGA